MMKVQKAYFVLPLVLFISVSACFVERTSAPENGLSSDVESTEILPSPLPDSEGMKGAECHFIYSESKCLLPDKLEAGSIKFYKSHYIRCGVNIDLTYTYNVTGQYLYQLRDATFVHEPDKTRPLPIDLERGIDFAEMFKFYAVTTVVFDTSSNKEISENKGTNLNKSDFYITHKHADKKNPNGKWVCEICLQEKKLIAQPCNIVNDDKKKAMN